jgi:two-component system response regulator HydG
VLTDLNMPGMNGLDLCRRIVESRPGIPVIVITAFGSLETAVGAIRAGAYDFVTKPFDLDMLALTVERAVQHHALQERVRMLSNALERTGRLDEGIGECDTMQSLFEQAERVAATEASVLVTGETGSGKEVIARAIHRCSRRKDGPFVPVNCPALPDTLIESELFGHARGAFTDARTERKGLFLEASGGTLFFDEIGDMPLQLQSKLLRALEDRRVRPVGGDREIAFDARILAATNSDLAAAVEAGQFREDLYFRINVVSLHVPPLRARGNDVLLLARHFLKRFAERSEKEVRDLSKPVAEKLLSYTWPGNVRELRNAIERAVALTRFDTLVVEDLPEPIRTCTRSDWVVRSDDLAELPTLEEVQMRYIRHVLDATGGNKAEAARVLGLDRKTLYRKLDRDEG